MQLISVKPIILLKGSLHENLTCYHFTSICLFSVENNVGNIYFTKLPANLKILLSEVCCHY